MGKTTVSANLAYALARSGSKVLAIDFDVQNALRLHFGVPISDTRGYVAQATTVMDWSQFILKADVNLFVLPYGKAEEEQRLAFENAIIHDPHHFLQHSLNMVLNYPGLVVIADFPPGTGPTLKAVQNIADLHIVMMLADTASLSLLPQIENHKFLGAQLNQRLGQYYVVNQSDMRRNLSRDVSHFLNSGGLGTSCWA